MKYDVNLIFYTEGVEDVEIKMKFIPRIGDKLDSEFLKEKCKSKACEVETVRFIYNDDFSEINCVEIGVRPTI